MWQLLHHAAVAEGVAYDFSVSGISSQESHWYTLFIASTPPYNHGFYSSPDFPLEYCLNKFAVQKLYI